MNSFSCLITASSVSESDIIAEPEFGGIVYRTKYGILRVTHIALSMLKDFCTDRKKRNILRGYIRNRNFDRNDVIDITSEILIHIHIPKNLDSFEAKWIHLLKYIERRGGKLRKPFRLSSESDYIITFSDDSMEFQRLGEYLFLNGYMDVSNPHSNFPRVMMDVTIKDKGMEFLHQGYKHTILNRLASNVFNWDEKVSPIVDKACELFFKENSSREEKRVACKSLADVIENIQKINKRLNKYFTIKDTNTFFKIVNEYEIRHNHEKIKRIEFEEQLEWVFYSLLNTLITYYKLESRLSN